MGKIDITKPYIEPKGIAALVHGLNLKSERMADIGRLWLERGYIIANLTLAGHESTTEWTDPSRKAWLFDFESLESAIDGLKAECGDLPCVCVAMSLGALMFVDHVLTTSSSTFTKAYFLAPALSIRRRSLILKGPSRLLPNLRIKSLSDPGYRVHNSLPLSFYREFYAAYDFVRLRMEKQPFPIPTQIFSHPNDELVSHRGLIRLSSRFESVQIKPLGRERGKMGYNHLMVNEETMGQGNWAMFTRTTDENIQ
ncbi:MAG TPA: alpha/beta hydrolase [Oligoflexus sp.]|uniref:serine aminopeptidase domain-containing protein n=1 Tax=Oligoflexus sp. TaxID=1971216 RepID=UPI002D2327D9|nr:alpha/beta hydrolase [Oligoflexus sp.]HYX38088.1 alpha/beta hydrolase [Oligoflexus sp.]